MAKVILVNPSLSTAGYSFITPRWLYVLAQATSVDSVGDLLKSAASFYNYFFRRTSLRKTPLLPTRRKKLLARAKN